MTNYQRERAHDVYDEMAPLFARHYLEIAHYQDIPLDPDRSAYENAEDAGNLRVYTARRNGVLIGYAVYFVRANIHYRSSVQAAQDILFIAPEHRRSRVGLELVKYCDAQLALDGVQVVYQHVKIAHDNLGALIEHVGYERIEYIYGKRLD